MYITSSFKNETYVYLYLSCAVLGDSCFWSNSCDTDLASFFCALGSFFWALVLCFWSQIMVCVLVLGARCVFRRDQKKTSKVDPSTYTYTYTHTHTYIHPCMHAYIHPCIHTYIHIYIHIYIHTYIQYVDMCISGNTVYIFHIHVTYIKPSNCAAVNGR